MRHMNSDLKKWIVDLTNLQNLRRKILLEFISLANIIVSLQIIRNFFKLILIRSFDILIRMIELY